MWGVWLIYIMKSYQKKSSRGVVSGFSGIKSNMFISTNKNSRIDRIVKHLFKFLNNKSIVDHRSIAGNDENIFDSAIYNIPWNTYEMAF